MKMMVLSLLTLSILLVACNPVNNPVNNPEGQMDAPPGPPACLTIIKFANKSHKDYLIAGHPITGYDPVTYDESCICFANNLLFSISEEETNDFLEFVERELKICGESPYIDLADGYVLLDWKWYNVFQLSTTSMSHNSLWLYLNDCIKSHTFVTNLLWSDLVDLSPISFTMEQGIELVEISDIKAISVKEMDRLRGQMKRPDFDFIDYASAWYYYDAMNPIQAYYYSISNPSKLEPYITFCDSMQNIYRDCLIEYIQKGELSKVIDK